MSFDIASIDKDLDYIICKKEKVSPALAAKWKWRILNEYPDELRQFVFAWANDQELPTLSYSGVTFERIIKATPFSFLDAVDLLYIMQKDPAKGYEIFSNSIMHDGGRRR